MKTHKEIADAIQCVDLVPSEDTNDQILDILHALNDRIEALDALCFARDGDLRTITANIGSDLAANEAELNRLNAVVGKLCDHAQILP